MLTRVLRQLFRRPDKLQEPRFASEQLSDLLNLEDLARADAMCRASLQAHPRDANLLQCAAVIAQRQGDIQRAIELLVLATEVSSDAQPLLGLGQALQNTGRSDDALRCYLRAIAIDPNMFEPRLAAAILFADKGESGHAEEQLQAALRIRPHSTEAENRLIRLLDAESRFADLTAQQHALQAVVPNDGRKIRLALVMPRFYDSVDQLHDVRRKLMRDVQTLLDGPALRVDNPVREIGMTTFNLAYHGENDVDVQKLIAQVCRKAYHPRRHMILSPARQSRIRIGFFSENLYGHSIGRLNKGLIAGLSREHFEVWVFTFARYQDSISSEIRAGADHCIAFGGESLEEIEAVIANQDLDVLFYPDIGMNPLGYFLAFSRLAPVQCVTWGHPVTTGIDTIDYFISAEAIEPADADAHYSERLVRLPAFFLPAYDRPPLLRERKTRAELGLKDSTHLYVCPQALFKLHPQFDEALAAILQQDSDGEIVLINGANPTATELLRRRFKRTLGEVHERVRFMPRMTWLDCLSLMANGDVMLDTFHFGGGNTTYEGLAMGVPIVTLPAAFLRGRFTLGCYRYMEIQDCIATTPQQYVDIALRLAREADFRAEVKAKIDERSGMLFGCDAAVRAFEEFCGDAVERARVT